MPHIAAETEHVRPCSGSSSFVGSTSDGAQQGRITLQGLLDAEAVDRLAAHLYGFLESGVRFITVDAHDVIRADPSLVPLLGRFQRRLTRRHGLLTMTGLHPSAFPIPAQRPAPASPVPGGRR
ncbi:STAS domain-containing protein [Actinomycetospora endophytica]|uniref:STAS domain-containing protein n=1 Tax=Actinomycetospora endophytica TaxID=2291215 RepID=A0ABS8PFZ2_9PSEU|nr:STAS domain-containing protein [Actinomycetospora endophytica]MCD2195924.1 STAS domain-containing protein [Actinomycetospora endophytica]